MQRTCAPAVSESTRCFWGLRGPCCIMELKRKILDCILYNECRFYIQFKTTYSGATVTTNRLWLYLTMSCHFIPWRWRWHWLTLALYICFLSTTLPSILSLLYNIDIYLHAAAAMQYITSMCVLLHCEFHVFFDDAKIHGFRDAALIVLELMHAHSPDGHVRWTTDDSGLCNSLKMTMLFQSVPHTSTYVTVAVSWVTWKKTNMLLLRHDPNQKRRSWLKHFDREWWEQVADALPTPFCSYIDASLCHTAILMVLFCCTWLSISRY